MGNFAVRNLMVTLEPGECAAGKGTPFTCLNMSKNPNCYVSVEPMAPPGLGNADMVLCKGSVPVHQLGKSDLEQLRDHLNYALAHVNGALSNPKVPATSPAAGPTNADDLISAANATDIVGPP